MSPQMEKAFDNFIEDKLEEQDIMLLQWAKDNNPEEFQEFLELVAFEERVNQTLKEQRSGQLLADIIVADIQSDTNGNGAELANRVLRELEPESKKKRRKRQKKAPIPFIPWSIAAILVFSFVLGAILFKTKKDPHIPTALITLVKGAAHQDGQAIALNSSIDDLSRLTIDKKAVFRLQDGSLVELTEDSEVSFNLTQKKLISLHSGELQAKINKQKDGSLTFETPHARAEILGTEFSLKTQGNKSWLNLTEGKIRYSAKNSQESRELKTGDHFCILENGTMGPALSSQIELLTLVNSKTGEDLQILTKESEITLAELPKTISIRAYLKTAQRMRFKVNNRESSIEENPPYYIKGNEGKTIHQWRVKPGKPTISIELLDKSDKIQSSQTIELIVKP